MLAETADLIETESTVPAGAGFSCFDHGLAG
jgi:hypothetical protein